MHLIRTAYQATPYQLKQIAKWAYSLIPLQMRYRKDFFKRLAWLEQSQWWSLTELEKYQNAKLKSLITHAYANVPYYRQLFQRHNISPSDIKTVRDLPKIPVLNKELLRKHFNDLVAANYDKKDLIYLSSSGTTGQPVRFCSEKRLEYMDGDPFLWRHYQWGGCCPTNIRATLAEWTIQPTITKKKRLFSYNPVRKLLVLSTYDLSKESIGHYAYALQRYQPEFLIGFPSALEILVKYFNDKGIARPANPKAIFTNSEVVYPWQRELIENYFGCKIYDWYALEERIVCACECEKHSGYHIFSDFGIVEFISDGEPVVQEKEGEIIATRLDNYAMPLIRYQTGDIGIPLKKKCSCGRGLPLMKLVGGRTRTFAVTKTGDLMPVTIVDIPNATENVEQFQFVQEQQGVLRLRIVKKEEFSAEDLNRVHKNLEQKFGEAMEVKVEFVDDIPRTGRAKLPILIQNLNVD